MVWCIFEIASGEFKDGESRQIPAHDPATQVAVQLPDYPDRRTERWDGAAIRPATQAEIDAYDAREISEEADRALATPLSKLLRDLFANSEWRHRLAGVEADDPRMPDNLRLPTLNSANASTRGAYTAALKRLLEAKI